MIENFYPNPLVVQRLQAGPLSAHIDIFAQQLFDEGYALWTVKYSVRLLADLTTWMQQQRLAISDLSELPVHTFFSTVINFDVLIVMIKPSLRSYWRIFERWA
jgi:hypothetical protein